MKYFTALVLLMFSVCSCAPAQDKPSIYQITKHDLPAVVQPGQRIVGHLTLKLVQKGSPFCRSPRSTFSVGSVSIDVPPDNMIPWEYPVESKEGDTFEQALMLDVPLSFPEGPAKLKLIGEGEGRAEFHNIDGTNAGNAFVWNCKVERKSADDVQAPALLVTRIEPIELDGKLDEPGWTAAKQAGGFVDNMSSAPASPRTDLYLAHTDSDLLIGAVCHEPNMKSIHAESMPGRDREIYRNECMEMFLDPRADRASFMHFIVDVMNQHFDALGQDPVGFNPAWESATYQGSDYWSVEIRIPFSSLATTAPKPGDFWLGNFNRERFAGGRTNEYSSWNATMGSFDSTGRFVPIIFDSRKAYLLKRADALSTESTKWPDDVRDSASGWLGDLASWRDGLNSMKDDELAASFADQERRLGSLEKQAGAYRLQVLRGSLGGRSFYVTRSWPYEPFKGQNGPLDSTLSPINLTLLKEEWADLAFNLTNVSDKPVTLRCVVRREEKAFDKLGFPGLNLRWQEALPVATADGNPTWDAIMQLPVGVVTISPGATSQVWLSMQDPAADKQATREGFVRFEPIDGSVGSPIAVPISIKVLPIVLTKNPPMHCFTWNIIGIPGENDPGWFKKHNDDLRTHGVDIYMMHGYSLMPRPKAKPDGTLEKLDFSRMDAVIEATKKDFLLYYATVDIFDGDSPKTDFFGIPFGTPAYEKAFKTWIKAVIGRFKQHGIGYDRFMINPADELSSDNCVLLTKWVKEVDPKAVTILDNINTLEQVKKFDSICDIWMPHYNHYQSELYTEPIEYLRKLGKPLWVYYYSEGANEKHEHPAQRYMYRFWWAYANHVTGMGYWAQQYYGDPWYRATEAGRYDTSLVYPSENELVPSRRWQAWRQGWQDTCLFDLAAKKLTAEKDSKGQVKLNNLIKDYIAMPADPAGADKARNFAKTVLEQPAK